jgi:hypothetical protein
MTLITILFTLAVLALCLAMAAPAPTIKGRTTLVWGTSGVAADGKISASIIKRIEHQRLGGPPTKIMDNEGYTDTIVFLKDGDMLTFTCIDQTDIAWPDIGDIVSCKAPGWAAAKSFVVEDAPANRERKREGEKTIVAGYYVKMDPLT